METEKFESVFYCPHKFEMVILNQNLLAMFHKKFISEFLVYSKKSIH